MKLRSGRSALEVYRGGGVARGVEDQMIKINVPHDPASFESGNGEGLWAFPLTPADLRLFDDESSYGDTIRVVLQNNCVIIPELANNTIVTCLTRGNKRPVLDFDWAVSVGVIETAPARWSTLTQRYDILRQRVMYNNMINMMYAQ